MKRAEQVEQVERFRKAFTCPRHEGQPVPCHRRDLQLVIDVPDTFERIDCPIQRAEACEPYTALEPARREAREERFLSEGRVLGIPQRLLTAAFERSQSTPALERVKKFIDTEAPKGECLVLMGPTGSGKTWPACCALRAWRPTPGKLSGDYEATTPRLLYFPALAGAWLVPERRERAWADATRRGLVVFDDFGTEFLKEGGLVQALTDELFWTRESACLPTIVTTNLTPEAFATRLSDRIVDRLKGPWGHVYEVAGPSMRTG